MELERLLELCDVLAECEFLPPGNFYAWARGNALREIREIIKLAQSAVNHGNTGTKTRE